MGQAARIKVSSHTLCNLFLLQRAKCCVVLCSERTASGAIVGMALWKDHACKLLLVRWRKKLATTSYAMVDAMYGGSVMHS